MNFKDFKQNVERLGDVWGLLTESTELDQVSYGKQEFLEYLEEDDNEKAAMELCDIIVFSINAARYRGCEIGDNTIIYGSLSLWDAYRAFEVGDYNMAIDILSALIESRHEISVEKIFDKTWRKISKRKGMMIDGKFVKYESMNGEQQAEFNRRDTGNTLIREG